MNYQKLYFNIKKKGEMGDMIYTKPLKKCAGGKEEKKYYFLIAQPFKKVGMCSQKKQFVSLTLELLKRLCTFKSPRA